MRFKNDPFKDKKEFKKFYEKEAINYDKIRSSDFEGNYIDNTEFELLTKQIGNKKKDRKISEMGCGTGRIILRLLDKGYDCTGMDASKNMLKQLKSKSNNSKNLKLVEGDIENLSFKDNTFDVTYSFKVLLHLKNWSKAFDEMYRITKKGGSIIFDIQNKNCPWRMLSFHKSARAYDLKTITKHLDKYNYSYHSLFSYPSFVYRIPLLKYTIPFFEKYIKFPKSIRRKYIFVVKKK